MVQRASIGFAHFSILSIHDYSGNGTKVGICAALTSGSA